MRFFITGASGYLGSALTKSLITEGHEVFCLNRGQPLPVGSVEMLWNGEYGSLIEFMNSVKPDLVFNLAAYSLSYPNEAQWDSFIDANIRLPLLLLEAMARSGCQRLIQAGSYWQFADNCIGTPLNTYALSKEMISLALDQHTRWHKLAAVTLHFGDIIGPCDPRPKLLPLLLQHWKSGKKMAMSSGSQLMAPLDIDDAVAALRQAVINPPFYGEHCRYLTVGEFLSVRDFVAEFERIIGVEAPVIWGQVTPASQVMTLSLDCIPSLIGWRRQNSLSMSIKRILVEDQLS